MSMPSFAAIRMLIVDPDASNAKSVLALLRDCGVKEINVSQTIPDMLQHLAAQRVDIIFCNWVSNNLPALDLLKCVRNPKASHNYRIPVIMIVSQPSIEQITTARDLGATEFLAMPLSLKAMERVLTSLKMRPRDFIVDPAYIGPDRRRRKVDVAKERRGKSKMTAQNKETEKA